VEKANYRIPIDSAQKILATFGLTKPTLAYNRWVKEDGFDLRDFDSVLFESPFIFVIDWRACLEEELEVVADTLAQLDVHLEAEFDEEGETGVVTCGAGRTVEVSYRPKDDSDLDGVFRALQSVVPENIQFRSSPFNDGSDTAVYAVLPRDEWADLEKEAPTVMAFFFKPLKSDE